MSKKRQLLFLVVTSLSLATNAAYAQPVIDDRFDDDDISTNSTGAGSGWNPSILGGTFDESNDVATLIMTGGAPGNGLLSKDTFNANSSNTTYGTFTYTELMRQTAVLNNNGGARWFAGFYDTAEDEDMDGFDAPSFPVNTNPTGGNHRGGFWIALKDSNSGPGDQAALYYTVSDTAYTGQGIEGATIELERWTWDRSVFEFQEDAIAAGIRANRVGQDLLVPLSVEISTSDTGYGIRFFSSDDNAILPPDMFGDWSTSGVLAADPNLLSLQSVRAAGFAGQNGGNANSAVTVEIDRVYVDDAPQRDADFSGLTYTWGARANDDGNWSDNDGWQVGGANTTTIPNVVLNSRSADAAEVLSGTVRVANADQGAWTVQVNNGATLEVASGRTLTVVENESGASTDIQSGGSLVLAGTLDTYSIAGAGALAFDGGTLRLVGSGSTIGNLQTLSSGTISNARETSIGQATMGAGHSLTKQRTGTLILDQSGGPNSFAASSAISIEAGFVAALNNAANNSLSSATVNLDGGNLLLSAQVANAVAFDSPVSVNTSGSIVAGQATGGLTGETITLGGTNGMTVGSGAVATLETNDGYTLVVAGSVGGDGTLSVADGASVDLTGNVAPAILGFQGDTSQVTLGPNVGPTEAFRFRPSTGTRNMVVDFQLSSAADVIILENDDVFNGTVKLNNTNNNYTGTTRIIAGVLISDAGGSPAGDYDNSGTVDSVDYDAWKSTFGGSVAPGTGADGNGNGIVDLADYTIWRDHLGATGGSGSGLPSASLLQFEGSSVNRTAVLQTSQDFSRNIGTSAGEVNWVGSGGFAAAGGGTVDVTLEGGAQLVWDSATVGFNGQNLKLGSPTADGTIRLTNDIDLNDAERTIELRDNQQSNSDVAKLSGVISSSGSGSDVLKVTGQTFEFENGLLSLTGQNTFSTLLIEIGTVVAEDGVGLPSSANLRFNPPTRDQPAIFAGSGTFTRNIGEGPGEVFWVNPGNNNNDATAGGFAAVGGDLTVTLEGGATLTPGSADMGFNNDGGASGKLQLGSPVADGIVNFTNGTTGGGTDNMFFETFDNPNSDTDGVLISGNHTALDLFRIDGDGPVEVSGTVEAARAVFVNNGGAGVLSLNVSGNVTIQGGAFDAEVNNGVGVFINGTLTMEDGGSAQAGNFSTLGGTGTIFMEGTGAGNQNRKLHIQGGSNGGIMNPGADFDTIGTLTIDSSAMPSSGPRNVIQNGGRFELEIANDGGSVVNDLLHLTATGGTFPDFSLGEDSGNTWILELDALNDLTGLISSTDEFDFITFNSNMDMALNGVVFNNMSGGGTGVVDNVIIESTEFDLTNVSVEYEYLSDFSGRIFVTGLELLSPSAVQAAAVPEPSTAALALLLMAAGAIRTRRAVS